MIETIKSGNSIVLKLSRIEKIWFCSECKREFKIAPPQCSCGAVDKVFLEKDLKVIGGKRAEYDVISNFIFESTHIQSGSVVSMIINDSITKSLLQRKLISEIAKSEAKIEQKTINSNEVVK